MPLERKIQISQTRIIEWYKHWGGQVVVSFSGGKDSTVLLHLVRSIFPDVKAVFSNTGLEYPEIQRHVRNIENVDIVTPAMRFDQVISTYGYPLIGKEVAEAIYYARRIKASKDIEKKENEHHINTSVAANRRTVLMGKMPSNTHTHTTLCKRNRSQKNGTQREQNPEWWNYEQKTRRRYELQGFKAGVGKQREGEETSTEPG